jgi:hypothetical protein
VRRAIAWGFTGEADWGFMAAVGKREDSMRKTILAMAFAACLVPAPPAAADHVRVGELVVSDAWARASAGKAKAGAAYLTVTNHGVGVDSLVAVETPVSRKASLHNHVMEGGVAKMRPVKAIEVDPGAPTVLKPGGLHIMLMGLTWPLKKGQRFPMTLTFEKAGEVTFGVEVLGVGAMDHDHDTGHGKPKSGS